MRIGYLSTAYHTSHIIREMGMLEERGIEGEWRLFGGGPAIVDSLSRGDLDLGYIGLPPVINGVAGGARIKCIAGGHVEGSVFVGKKEAKGSVEENISSYPRIASPPEGSIHDVILRYWIDLCGHPAEVVNYPWADIILDEMVDGGIEAAVGTPSLAVLAMKYGGAKILVPPSRLWKDNPSYGIVVRENCMGREEIKEFLALHEEVSNFLRLEPEKAAQIIAGSMDVLSPRTVEEIIRLSPRYCASLSRSFISSTMKFMPVLNELGYISREVGKGEIFDFSLIEKLHPQGGHY